MKPSAIVRRFGVGHRRDARFVVSDKRPPLLRGLGQRHYGYEIAAAPGLELHLARDEGEQGVVLAHADIRAGMPLRAALAHDDVARNHGLGAELLDAEAPAGGVAAVAGRAACFFVCHGIAPEFCWICVRTGG
ncbi:protein of unknown function [Methylorubrum extorquens]|uniref:Uncharacterized protein n=1 Tax=Methylorubrum extorquens TaxID=408 RepID=A0A2N9AJV6_METEX|nr:protein of unknown function [Methylorubrum extorquens]